MTSGASAPHSLSDRMAASESAVALTRYAPPPEFEPATWRAFAARDEGSAPRTEAVQTLLCDALEIDGCSECLERAPSDAASCAIERAFAGDEAARDLALDLFHRTGIIAGAETRRSIDSAHLGDLPIAPALPLGEDKQHLAWLATAFDDIEAVFTEIAPRAPRPIVYRTRPIGIRFYATEKRSYPSAYGEDGIVGYNVRGVLHESADLVRTTTFHEIFHLNDQARGAWTSGPIAKVFARIVEQCGDDHECLTPFAPDGTTVDGGTYYAFDPRTRDPREYGAELALRWFEEHRAIVRSGRLEERPFKCKTKENLAAWTLVVDEFFGSLDLTPSCEAFSPEMR